MFFKQLNQSSKAETSEGIYLLCVFIMFPPEIFQLKLFTVPATVSWPELSWKWEISDCKKDTICESWW